MAPQPEVNIPPEALAKLGRVLQIVAVALLASQLLILAVAVVVQQIGAAPSIPDPGLFIGIGSVMTASALVVAILMANRLVRLQDASGDRIPRLRRASVLLIVRLAVLEAAGIANIVFYLLTGDLVFLAALAVCLLAFIVFRPTPRFFEGFRNMSEAPPIG